MTVRRHTVREVSMRRLLRIMLPVLVLLAAVPAHAGLLGIHPGFKVGLTVAKRDDLLIAAEAGAQGGNGTCKGASREW